MLEDPHIGNDRLGVAKNSSLADLGKRVGSRSDNPGFATSKSSGNR